MDKSLIAAELRTDEGNRTQLYRDNRGFWTIGDGFCIDPSIGCSVPQPVVDFWLSYLVDQKIQELSKFEWFNDLDAVRQQLIVCLDYNTGENHLLTFLRMIKFLSIQNYSAAADELQDSAWFNQVGLRGPKYVNILRTGVWQ